MQVVASWIHKTIFSLYSFSYQPEKLCGIELTPIPYETLHFRDRHEAASSVAEIAGGEGRQRD